MYIYIYTAGPFHQGPVAELISSGERPICVWPLSTHCSSTTFCRMYHFKSHPKPLQSTFEHKTN